MKIGLHVAIRVPNERAREFDLEFAGPEVLIGRDRECDIQVPLNAVSRKHAKIVEEGGEWFVEDLKSTHGTKVNGQLIGANGKKLLREGDVVEIVQASITFHLFDEVKIDENNEEKTAVVAQKMVRDLLDQPSSSADDPYLLVMNGPNEGLKTLIRPDTVEFTIGRIEGSDLRIDDANVSRKHARIKREWNDLLIEDLGSKNGVVVNGRKITTPTRLKDADEIYLGAVHLTFIDPNASIIGRLEEMAAFASATPAASPPAAVVSAEAASESPKAEPEVPIVASPAPMPVPPKRIPLSSGIGGTEILLVALAVIVAVGLIVGIMLVLT